MPKAVGSRATSLSSSHSCGRDRSLPAAHPSSHFFIGEEARDRARHDQATLDTTIDAAAGSISGANCANSSVKL